MKKFRLKFHPWRQLWEKEKEMGGLILGKLRLLWTKMDQDDILFLASGLAFNVLICLLPILLLWIYVLGLWFQSTESMRFVDNILEAAFPNEIYAKTIRENISEILKSIVANRKSLGLLSVAVLAGASASLFSSTRSVLHHVFQIKTRRHFLASYLVDLGLVLGLTLLILVITSLTWVYRFVKSLRDYLPPVNDWDFHGVVGAIADLTSLPIILGLCYLLYRYVPVRRTRKWTALVAAATTSIIWEISGRAFAVYLGSLSSISKVYGAYAFILVFLIWVYYSCVIFVVGAEVGYISQDNPQPNPMDSSTELC